MGFLVGEEEGLFFIWHGGLLAAYPVDGIAAGVRCGDGWGRMWFPGGVLTAVMVRVSSEADSRTGAEATSRPIPGERL